MVTEYYSYHMQLSVYRGADKSLARPTSRCILFDGENILFDASLVIYTRWVKNRYTVYSILYTYFWPTLYINNTNIPPIMIINKIYETQTVLSL